MRLYSNAKPSPRARGHMIFLKTTYLAETNDYTSGVADITVEQKDLNISSRARNYFVTGMNEYQKNNAAALDNVIQQLAGERLIEEAKDAENGIRICGNINRSLACLLYTSDAADDLLCVDHGGWRFININHYCVHL